MPHAQHVASLEEIVTEYTGGGAAIMVSDCLNHMNGMRAEGHIDPVLHEWTSQALERACACLGRAPSACATFFEAPVNAGWLVDLMTTCLPPINFPGEHLAVYPHKGLALANYTIPGEMPLPPFFVWDITQVEITAFMPLGKVTYPNPGDTYIF